MTRRTVRLRKAGVCSWARGIAGIAVASAVLWPSGAWARTGVRLEETLDATRAAAVQTNAGIHRAIEARAARDPAMLGEPAARWATTRNGVPTSGESRSLRESGPVRPALDAAQFTPAIGGGPRTVQSLVPGTLPGARGVRETGVRTVVLPLGCSRIEAAGAPRVERITIEVSDRRGRIVARQTGQGRGAVLSFCPVDDGAYHVRARSVGGTVAAPVQLFVE